MTLAIDLDIENSPCTLEMQLFDLIDEYGLPEVLDRLAHLLHEQSGISSNAPLKEYWNALGKHMEDSVHLSLHIKGRDPQCGRWAT